MKKVWNVLLGFCAAICLYPLVFQGFAFPYLSSTASVILRIVASVCIQLLLCQLGKNALIKALPLMVTGFFAVFGFFLFLTSPPWQALTFGDFLVEYASPVICCAIVWVLYRYRAHLPKIKGYLPKFNRKKSSKKKRK